MHAFTIENILVLLILTVGVLVIVFIFVYCLQKVFKTFFSPLFGKPSLSQSAFQHFDFRDSFYDHDAANEAFPSNYQTINIYSLNTPHQNPPAPSINISMKSMKGMKDYEENTLEAEDEKMERLINYANNFCRSSYNLKWKNKFLKKMGSRSTKMTFLITILKKTNYYVRYLFRY